MRISDWSSDVCSSDLHIMSDWLDQDDLRQLAEADPSLKSLNTILHGEADSPLSGRLQFLDVEDGLFCSINEWRSRRAYEDRVIVRDTLGIQFVQAGRVKQSLPGGDRKSTRELQSLMRISYAC